MGAFDEILDDLKVAPEDRETLKPIIEKYPEFQDAVMRRKTYGQKLDELDREKATRAKDYEELEAWRTVTKENWDPAANDGKGDWKQHVVLRQQLTEAEQKAADLQKLVEAGGEMDFDQVLSGLKDKGVVMKTDIAGLMPKSEYETDVAKRLDTMGVNTEIVFASVAPLVTKYTRDFPGDDLDVRGFMQFTTANKLWTDPQKAYEQFTAGKRQQLELDRLKKEAEEADKRGYERARAEKQAERQPDDTGGNTPVAMGPLQKRLMELKKGKTAAAEAAENAKLGDMAATAAGLEALRNGTLVNPGT